MENYATSSLSSLSQREREKKSALKRKLELEARLVRQSFLAKPHPRRLVPTPDPRLYYKGTRPISQASLIYRPSKRIKLLSKLPEIRRREKYVKPEPPKHLVSPAALNYIPSPRILELAKISSESKIVKEKSKKHKKKKLDAKKLLEEYYAWIELRSKPKPIPQPTPLKVIKPAIRLSPEEKEELMRKLAKPKYKYQPYKERPIVNPAALKYVPSKRILEISGPKELDPETVLSLNYNPYKIKWTALHYKASERIIEIAAPNVRKKKDDGDMKENPFAVNPRALKAICSKRCKELAKPVERD